MTNYYLKDNIDFEKLKKFGFKLESMYGSSSYNRTNSYNDTLAIFISDRKIFLDTNEYSKQYLLKEIEDLIKEDLIVEIMNERERKQ